LSVLSQFLIAPENGNTLTRNESYGGLFVGAPDLFDVILMNPPFGGRESRDALAGLRRI